MYLRPFDGLHSVDKDGGVKSPGNWILMQLGKSAEKLLTLPYPEFESKLLRTRSRDIYTAARPCIDKETYNYLHYGNLLLRSQLDCIHSDAGIFDLKTRAINPIRNNLHSYTEYLSTSTPSLPHSPA